MRNVIGQNSEKNRIVIDTYAWIEYFKGSDEGLKAKKFIDNDFLLFTPSMVIAELSRIYRKEGKPEWDSRRKFISAKSRITELDEITADKSGELKQELRKIHKDIGLADAIIASHASKLNARILTGDKHLKNLDNSIDISH